MNDLNHILSSCILFHNSALCRGGRGMFQYLANVFVLKEVARFDLLLSMLNCRSANRAGCY